MGITAGTQTILLPVNLVPLNESHENDFRFGPNVVGAWNDFDSV